MDQVRIGVLGAGAMGTMHAAHLAAAVDGVRLAAVAADHMAAPVAEMAARARARLVSVDALFDPSEVDAVVIATPTDTHHEYVTRAVMAGLSVFCEKPLVRTEGEAVRLSGLAESRDVKVAVGHVVRYYPEYAAARELVRRGELGPGLVARLARRNRCPAETTAWYGDFERSGGVLLDMAIHDIDWCLWTFGPADRVYAVGSAAGGGGHGAQVVSVMIRHEGGALSCVDASWRDESFSTRLEISGVGGVYSVGGSGDAGFQSVAKQTAGSYLPTGADAPSGEDPYARQLDDAIKWFRGGPPPRATIRDAAEAVRAVAAAQRSIETGQPVYLSGVHA